MKEKRTKMKETELMETHLMLEAANAHTLQLLENMDGYPAEPNPVIREKFNLLKQDAYRAMTILKQMEMKVRDSYDACRNTCEKTEEEAYIHVIMACRKTNRTLNKLYFRYEQVLEEMTAA